MAEGVQDFFQLGRSPGEFPVNVAHGCFPIGLELEESDQFLEPLINGGFSERFQDSELFAAVPINDLRGGLGGGKRQGVLRSIASVERGVEHQ